MKLGDFSKLAKYYDNRPEYSKSQISFICDFLKAHNEGKDIKIADVGAGTGILTKMLWENGLTGYAVEPNDEMRARGYQKFEKTGDFVWSKGTGEETGLPNESVDFVCMGDSFHWTDASISSKEFNRILKPGGYFMAIWKPRDILSSELHKEIESIVYAEKPELKRVSSGMSITTEIMQEKLGQYFEDIIFLESKYSVTISKKQYMNSWYSVNDIQAQLGEVKFKMAMDKIETLLERYEAIEIPYKSRAWIAKVVK